MDNTTWSTTMPNLTTQLPYQLVTSVGNNLQNASQPYAGQKASEMIWTYCAPIILILGTSGNILTLIVLKFATRLSSTIRLIFLALTLTDLGVLWTAFFSYFFIKYNGNNVQDLNVFSCKLHNFFTYYWSHASAWILVVLSLERTVAVVLPFKARMLFSTSKTGYILLGVLIALAALDCNILWAVYYKNGACTNVKGFFGVWTIIDLCVSSLVPFLVMTTSTAVIVTTLRQRFRNMKEMDETCSINRISSRESAVSRAQLAVTFMLIAANVFFVLLTMPVAGFLLYESVNGKPKDETILARYNIGYTIANQLLLLNSSVNFFLYCCTGRPFRQGIISVYRKVTRKYLDKKTTFSMYTMNTQDSFTDFRSRAFSR